MDPVYHLTITLIVAAYACVQGNSLYTLFLVLAFGFLIDLDHYLTYWVAKHDYTLNPLKVYRWIERTFKTNQKPDLNDYLVIFHEFEVVLLISVTLVIISKPIPLAAYLIHQVMDRVNRRNKDPRAQSLYRYISKLK